MKYRSDIDGLRCLAISSVLLYHLKLIPLQGGYLGVDIFFVISGYLITSLILHEIESTGDLSFSNFYLRRIRRILPASIAMLWGAAILGYFILVADFWDNLYESILSSLFYISNIFFYFGTGYWDFTSTLKPLLHMWSLGVEEQFYIFFPFFIYVAYAKKKSSKLLILLLLILLSIASLILCLYLRKSHQEFTFYMLPTRLWELSAGAIVASLPCGFRIPQKLVNFIQILALIVIILCLYYAPGGVGKWNMLTVTASIVLILDSQGIISRVFSFRLFVFIGKISYSLYLWHWPLWVLWTFKKTDEIDITDSLTVLGITFAISLLSWLVIEQPFRKVVSWRLLAKALIPPTVLLGGFAVFCLLFPRTDFQLDIPRLSPMQITMQQAANVKKDIIAIWGPKKKPQFVLIGDSHATALFPAFADICNKYGVTGGGISNGSTLMLTPEIQPAKANPLEGTRDAESALQYIDRNKIRHVVVAQRWGGYGYIDDNHLKEETAKSILSLINKGCYVYLVEDIPIIKSTRLYAQALSGKTHLPATVNSIKVFNSVIARVNNPALKIIKTQHLFNPKDEQYQIVKNGKMLYVDDQHLSIYGSDVVKPAFIPFIQQLTEKK